MPALQRFLTLVGIAMFGAGLVLPWAEIGGRDRSATSVANLLLGLNRYGLPSWISGFGWLVYASILCGLVAWVATVVPAWPRPRSTITTLCLVAMLCGGVLTVALDRIGRGVLLGPVVASCGLVLAGVISHFVGQRPRDVGSGSAETTGSDA